MSRNLTKKQKVFVDEYVETGIATQAAMKAYPDTTYDTQRVIGSENLTKPYIVKAIEDALPDDLLAKVHMEGLEATAVRFTPEGEQIDVPDYATRHKYLDAAYKIKGKYAAEKHIVVTKKLIQLDD